MPTNAQTRLAMVLQALGDSAEDIANLLRFGGWRGRPNDVHACPLALYLRTVVNDVTDAVVSSDQATIHTSDGDDIEVALTSAAAGFVLAFDIGAYPELIVTATGRRKR